MDYNHNMEDSFPFGFETMACRSTPLPSHDELQLSAKRAGSWSLEDQFGVDGDLFSELQGFEALESSGWVTETIDLPGEELENFTNIEDVLEMSEASSPLSIISDNSFIEEDIDVMFSSEGSSPLSIISNNSFIEDDLDVMFSPQGSSPLSIVTDDSFIEENINATFNPQSDSEVSCTYSFEPSSPADVSVVPNVIEPATEASQSITTSLPTVDLSAIIEDTLNPLSVNIIASNYPLTKRHIITEVISNSAIITSDKVAISKLSSPRTSPYPKSNPNKIKERTPVQRLRKKAQNRDAALKYRSKKKGELEALFDEAKELEESNNGLKEQVQGISKEIEYLKKLMLDVIKARLNRNGSSVLVK